ncbi:histone-like nucleoid-structuring protein Lsr2 [Streptomyces cyaneofuscatus]|uniref:Lsr2 family DNA-binding protein n=1 Tax=Streptomyces cyaneofuscatus TaxID=66883 RepID=UPI00344D9BA3
MFTDWSEALEAESLPPWTPPRRSSSPPRPGSPPAQHDKDDLGLLLDALGLPTDPDMITALLPLIPETGDTPVTTTAATEPIDVPVTPLPASHPVQELLDWAAAHPAAQVRNRAARISTDLTELTERRSAEAAQREAEEKVARARAELERAQEELRTVKAGTRTTAAGPTSGRTGSGSGRTREEFAAIRTWARAHGHQVADLGMVPKRIQEAYDTAHQDSARKAG